MSVGLTPQEKNQGRKNANLTSGFGTYASSFIQQLYKLDTHASEKMKACEG